MLQSISTFIAFRFLKSKTSDGYLSFMAFISMIGLVIGVSTLIVVMSVLNGFQKTLNTKILGMVPQVIVIDNSGIEDWKSLAEEIESNDNRIEGSAPLIRFRGMAALNGEMHGSIVNGIDYNYESKVSLLPKVMSEGSLESLQPNKFNIVMGKRLANEHDLKIGDSIPVMIVKSNRSKVGIDPEYYNFTLSGLFDVSNNVDSWLSYINIQDAKTITGANTIATGIRLKSSDVMKVDSIADKALKIAKNNDIEAKVTTWFDTHRSLYESIILQKRKLSLLLLLIIIVATFNIISALVMMTTEKKSEIAILKTFGATKTQIIKIFLGQGFMIGSAGVLIGIILGVILSLNIGQLSASVNSLFNLDLFDNYYVTQLPSKIEPLEVLIIAIVSLIFCLLASIYPALKAANSTPIQGLKSE